MQHRESDEGVSRRSRARSKIAFELRRAACRRQEGSPREEGGCENAIVSMSDRIARLAIRHDGRAVTEGRCLSTAESERAQAEDAVDRIDAGQDALADQVAQGLGGAAAQRA
jgi:hypothetical protein